jgi:hypothetical protein
LSQKLRVYFKSDDRFKFHGRIIDQINRQLVEVRSTHKKPASRTSGLFE